MTKYLWLIVCLGIGATSGVFAYSLSDLMAVRLDGLCEGGPWRPIG